MTRPLVLPLTTPDATLANAGGKGMNLARLALAGFPVPGGFIVVTDAYRAFVAANGLSDRILEAVNAAPVDDPAALEAASQVIRARFAAGALPAGLADALSDAYVDLGRPAVAVRSSATAEDLPDMSFAGQQDTFLNVIGEEALLRAVVDCWSSLWTARAIAYRARNGIPHDDVALAVVVQTMVPSEASGVLFTANPLTGRRGEAVIDATLGLGEALVGGQVEPDNYVVDTAGGRIVSKTLGAKAVAVRGQAGGGTVTTREDAGERQALPDAAILELARLGAQVEAQLYGGQPQDIEWAWADGKLTLLQSRAITSLFPLPDGMPPEPLQILFSLNHVQGMLDPFTPLGQDALALVLLSFFRAFGHHAGLETQREIRGGRRAALHQLHAGAAASHVPARDRGGAGFRRAELTAGRPRPAGRSETGAPRRRAQLQDQTAVGTHLPPPRARPGGHAAAARCPPRRDVAEGGRCAGGDGAAFSGCVLSVRATGAVAGRLRIHLQGGLPHDVPRRRRRHGQLLPTAPAGRQGVRGATGWPWRRPAACRTTSPPRWTWRCGPWRRPSRPTRRRRTRFAAADPRDPVRGVPGRAAPAAAQAALSGFMERYGFRGLAEIDLGRPRWREDPAHIMQVVQSYARITDPEQAPDAVFRRGAEAAAGSHRADRQGDTPSHRGPAGAPVRLAHAGAGGPPRVPQVHADPDDGLCPGSDAAERPGAGRRGRAGPSR